jgi:mannan endo-1,4-beta-mannosidase
MALFKNTQKIALFLFGSFVYLCFGQTTQTLEAENARVESGATVVSNTSASGGKEVQIKDAGQVTWILQSTKGRTYQLEFQYRSPYGDKKQILLIDGVQQEIIFPKSSNFSQVQLEKYLAAGTHTVQIKKDWGWFFIDNLKFISPSITIEDFTKLECENGTIADASIFSDASFSGGKGVRFLSKGKITIALTVSSSGYYGINIGYKAPYGDKTQTLTINGTNQQIIFKQSSVRTTYSIPVLLNSGSNSISITASWGWMDFDYIELIAGRVDNLDAFVKVSGMKFTLNNSTYTFLGTNAWYLMNLGAPGDAGDRGRLTRELDRLKNLGIKNIRIQAGSEGPNSEPLRGKPSLQVSPGILDQNILKGLDFTLNEMGKRNMKAVMVLNNFWEWSGGFGQYLVWAKDATSIPYPPPYPNGDWNTYQIFVSRFYGSTQSQALYKNFIRQIIFHKNHINGKIYKTDETIMSWELANEPRAISNVSNYYSWIKNTSTYIKSLDAFHLVTIGSEGDTPSPDYTNNDYQKDHNFPNIDYGTMHIWPENFGWYDPKNPNGTYSSCLSKTNTYIDTHIQKTRNLQKPLVLEEFGLARDNGSYNPASVTTWRDKYYTAVFDRVYQSKQNGDPMPGVALWAWSGEGRPRTTSGNLWQVGDSFLGDPAHEPQGWYGVYDIDTSTKNIIQNYTAKINTIY